MRTRAQSQREVAENLAVALANPHRLPSIVEQFQSFSTRRHSRAEGKSASQAGCSDLHPTTFHTLSPRNRDDGLDPDPDYPDGDPDGGGSGDRDVPKDLAEPPEDPLVALARAVHALARSSLRTGDSTPKTKVCEPDTFDGSDPKKLREFLVQCELNFQDRPHAFHSDRAKVTFAQSYLKGMALAWFKPDLLNPDNYDRPLWMDDYHEFLQELTANFGLHDAIADAVQQLENLTMKDGSRITKYVVEFNRWASQVKDYGVGALRHHFYSGLPDRIKDEIARVRKPSTLTQLRELAQTIDAHYWERKAEILRTTKSASNKSQSSNSDNKTKSSSSSSSAPKSDTKGKGKQKDLPKSDTSKSDIAHLLGKDGKLTSAECQCRMKNNLCLFCGEAGHSAKDCPKSTSRTAKAHAATAETLPTPPAEKAEELAQPGGSVEPNCAPPDIRLNASALSSPNSLLPSVTLPDYSVDTFSALIDSGSSHCFVDPSVIKKYAIPVSSISLPIPLRLFDGSTNAVISQEVDLSLRFPSGDVNSVSFYVTPLDSSCSLVLGHNWLTHFNPSIDWVLGSISFKPLLQGMPTPQAPLSSSAASSAPDLTPSAPFAALTAPLTDSPCSAPLVSLINAAAYVRACALPGSRQFRLQLSADDVKLRVSSASSPPPDLSSVPPEYHEFADVFSKDKATELPPHRLFDLKIDLEEGASPPIGTIYSLSLPELEALHTFIDEHLGYGFIKQSTSAHGLNKITKKDCYPLLLISDLLDSPSRAKVYTKIDLRHAYHLVCITDGDEWKTAFRTRYGSYEWQVMPFGLTNAPAAFQRFVNSTFADMLDVCIVVYLNDILIYSQDVESHCEHVKEVLRRLRKHGLYAKPEKCEFHSDSVEYLSYVLSPSGLTMSAEKVQAVRDWPEPQKGAPWNFSEECRSAFLRLKDAFSSAPILTHWVPDALLTVETDASDYAIAGILSITCSDGELRPVAFYSRTMTTPELNYDTHDKELLAIFEAFHHWRHYLEGSALPVDMVTDHKNLEYFSTSKVLTRRQAHWSEYLSQFNLSICFRPGRLGAKPDALTQHWDVYPKGGDRDYAQVNPHNLHPMFTQEQLASSLCTTTLMAPVLRAAMVFDVECLHSDIVSTLPSDPVSASHLPTPTKPRWSLGSDGLLRLDGRIFVADIDDLRLRVLRFKHDHPLAGHFGQNRTLELVCRDYVWPNLRSDVKEYVRSCTACGWSKTLRHCPYGLLKQLPVPERPWNSISMDFIEHLPNSDGYSAILMVVDHLSKQAVFIPTHDSVTSAELAKLFLTHVFSKHGVPANVTSNRGPEFVSHFFCSLGKALDMCLHFTSGYHPEGDGQTERTNQTLEQYLRVYCNYQQDNWAELLPLAEFAFNNAPSVTTGVSPFFANKGYHPNLSVVPDQDFTSPRAHDYIVELSALHDFLHSEMSATQQRYQGPADAKRIPPPGFKVGEQAYIKAKYFRSTRPSEKHSEKYLGPFTILARPVFHVSQLEAAAANPFPNRQQPPPPPVDVDGDLEYESAGLVTRTLMKKPLGCLQLSWITLPT
ncbi:hypothetical protein M404DRAFT_31093 [Pisolithus tinctorius Marx 270]|uniref:Uncharacterized protein n=1 Tax=Pisolithus tinctorius Marx 270 TaxID=870435 RepID=A0A0C3NTJ3_PISTI|nr:hypothetical protein M404DRAFT_31093 [Pisolithus tinctorius Marx 270]